MSPALAAEGRGFVPPLRGSSLSAAVPGGLRPRLQNHRRRCATGPMQTPVPPLRGSLNHPCRLFYDLRIIAEAIQPMHLGLAAKPRQLPFGIVAMALLGG